MKNSELLKRFVGAYPAQPATAYWRAIEIGALLRYGIPDGVGLDLGCGDGILTEIILGESGFRCMVGVDPDPLEIASARKFSFYQRLHVAPGDAIPESDNTFDFILSNSVLEHVAELEPTIAEASRVLRPGGKFIITAPAPGFHRNLYGSLAPGVTREAYLEALDRRLYHLHYLTSSDWAEMFRRNGLKLSEAFGYLDKRETQRWENLSRMTGGLLYSLFGEKKRPIEIQRLFGARSIQNKLAMPRPVATLVAYAIALNAPVDRNENIWIGEDQASCLLIVGSKIPDL